jgi:hypothetical protein
MRPGLNLKVFPQLIAGAVIFVLLTACAPSVKVRSDADPSIDLTQFRTYGFFSQLGVEEDGYSNLLGQHFREAVASQMDSRGFSQTNGPQLQVNVSIGSKDKVRVNTYSDPYLYGGHYGMRGGYGGGYGGMYGSPMGYGYGGGTRTTVHQYTEAQVYIDLVDSIEHKMVWQGVATFTVTDKMQQQIRATVYSTVDKIFSQFPIAAPESGN